MPVLHTEPNYLAVAGICCLILGGAFVLRALTESQTVPRLIGAILGMLYAAVWIWRANRYYATTAVVIAFPLIWETSVRFQIITPLVAGVLIGVFGLLFLWAAIRTKQQLMAWIGSIAAIAAAFAVGPSVEMLISISAIGAVMAFVARQWDFAFWPAAIAANVIALILIVTHPAGTPIALIAYAALWLRSSVQANIAMLIGVGGATYLLISDPQILSWVWCAAGLIAAEVSRRLTSRALAIESVVWIVGGAALLPMTGFAGLIAFARLRWREERLVLLMVFLYAAFMMLNSVISAPLMRTAILAVFASLLAVIGRFTGNWESSVLARIVLVVGGIKLLAEDLRVGSAAILVIAFVLYGAALMVVSRYKLSPSVQ